MHIIQSIKGLLFVQYNDYNFKFCTYYSKLIQRTKVHMAFLKVGKSYFSKAYEI
jgi:hypothetical protein